MRSVQMKFTAALSLVLACVLASGLAWGQPKQLAVLELSGDALPAAVRAEIVEELRIEALKYVAKNWQVMTGEDQSARLKAAPQPPCPGLGACAVETFRALGVQAGIAGAARKVVGELHLKLELYNPRSGKVVRKVKIVGRDEAELTGQIAAKCKALFTGEEPRVSESKRRVELSEDLDFYAEPSTRSMVVKRGRGGQKYELIEERPGWVRVSLYGATTGWARRDRLKLAGVAGEDEVQRVGSQQSQPDENEAVVKVTGARLYGGPGGRHVVIKKLREGQTVEVLGRDPSGSWVKVRLDGPPAWMRASDLRMSAAAQATLGADRLAEAVVKEVAADPSALPLGLVLSAGIGFTQIEHKMAVNGAPLFIVPTPAFSLAGDLAFWFHRHVGARLRLGLDYAPSRFEVNPDAFPQLGRDEAVALTVSTLSFDAAVEGRIPLPVARSWVVARAGWKIFDYDVDPVYRVGEEASGNPLFYPARHQGLLLGAGVHWTVRSWIGLRANLDLIPSASVKNHGAFPPFDTPSGNLEADSGFHMVGAFWLSTMEKPVKVDVEVRAHWLQMAAAFSVPAGFEGAVPRSQVIPQTRTDDLGPYRSAESTEASLGVLVYVVLRP